ncbi:MAG: (S)-2-hydroxyglutarate dehydrogenase [Thermoplasmata archaeon]|jgi:L-2-hydroxyglutarate oxidase|nr:(S)-2-hydroxyglutarate dehydrogenase [Thermoplasmata archaeon]
MQGGVAIVGAGAVGASAALHLARAGVPVTVLEKEPGPARHQSGRNSGVVHAGYNAKPGTDKARYCVAGNRELRRYLQEKGLPILEGGILVVARTEAERATLAELQHRARANGVANRMLDAAGIHEREPHAQGIEALWALEAASLDAPAYVAALVDDAKAAGAEFRFGVRVRSWSEDPAAGVRVATDQGTVEADVMVNAAGLHADRVAAALCKDLRVVPFRGFYAELRPERTGLVRSHIYAAPDLQFPFLGVHLSRRTDGRVMVGPGAMLALGREAYRTFGMSARDLGSLLSWPGFWRMMADRQMLRLARTELAKSLRLKAIWKEARLLVPEVQPQDLVRAHAGNRAQLVDRRGKLVDDIVVRETGRTVHVLNAVSPGLTCSLPFGAELARRAEEKLSQGR